MVSQTVEKIEYDSMEAKIKAIMINEINEQDKVKSSPFMETFSLKQVIEKFGQKGYEATYGETLQLYQRTYFKPIKVAVLNPRDRKIVL